MRVRPVLPYATFAAAFIALAVGSFGLADILGLSDWIAYLLAYGVAAPASVLVALAVGPLMLRRLIATSIVVTTLLIVAAGMVMMAFGVGLGSAVSRLHTLRVALELLLSVFAPSAWLVVLRWQSFNNAFNRTPLRGAGQLKR